MYVMDRNSVSKAKINLKNSTRTRHKLFTCETVTSRFKGTRRPIYCCQHYTNIRKYSTKQVHRLNNLLFRNTVGKLARPFST